jgi:hypothetical protein
MKTKLQETKCGNETRFELKYCERCGGLWLRPVGGGQVYCVGCAREIADLPPVGREGGKARMQRGPEWGTDHLDYDDVNEAEDPKEEWHE